MGVLPTNAIAWVYLHRGLGSPQALQHLYQQLRQLRFNNVRGTARRTALRGSRGGELVIGYLDHPMVGWVERECPASLLPLLRSMSGLFHRHLPRAWRQQRQAARANGSHLLSPIFSTLTINHNALFRYHTDGRNVSGYSCITAFGNFKGAELCLPRLRVAFALQPGALLMFDGAREQHGNLGFLSGDRISVVAYLRKLGSH